MNLFAYHINFNKELNDINFELEDSFEDLLPSLVHKVLI
jgi:hypothetical protein